MSSQMITTGNTPIENTYSNLTIPRPTATELGAQSRQEQAYRMKFAIDLVLNSIGEDGFARGIKKLISSNQLRFNYDSNFARNARNSGFNNSVDATNTVFRDEQSRFRSAEIVLGDQALRSPASAIVAVVHELAHVYQAQNNYAGDRNQIEIKAYTLSNQVTTELANRFSQSSNTAERELASEIRGLLTIEQRALQSYIRDAQRR